MDSQVHLDFGLDIDVPDDWQQRVAHAPRGDRHTPFKLTGCLSVSLTADARRREALGPEQRLAFDDARYSANGWDGLAAEPLSAARVRAGEKLLAKLLRQADRIIAKAARAQLPAIPPRPRSVPPMALAERSTMRSQAGPPSPALCALLDDLASFAAELFVASGHLPSRSPDVSCVVEDEEASD